MLSDNDKDQTLEEAKRIRVIELMEHLAVSQSGLSKLIHMSQGYISHIVSGKKPMTRKFVRNLREYAGVNIDWLLTGVGDMFDASYVPGRMGSPLESGNGTAQDSLSEAGRSVPLINIPMHGEPLGDWDDIRRQAYLLRLPAVMAPEIDAIFRMAGFALYPRIKPDALIYARELPTVIHLPSGMEHVYIILARETLRVGYINNHHDEDGHIVLYFADDARNTPERYATAEIKRVWYAALVLQLP